MLVVVWQSKDNRSPSVLVNHQFFYITWVYFFVDLVAMFVILLVPFFVSGNPLTCLSWKAFSVSWIARRPSTSTKWRRNTGNLKRKSWSICNSSTRHRCLRPKNASLFSYDDRCYGTPMYRKHNAYSSTSKTIFIRVMKNRYSGSLQLSKLHAQVATRRTIGLSFNFKIL